MRTAPFFVPFLYFPLMFKSIQKLTYNPYFDTYLKLVQIEELEAELKDSQQLVNAQLLSLSDADLRYRYQPGKWTVAQLILHFIETEQIFNFRALTISREENVVNLEGFDENRYANQGMSEPYSVQDLSDYFNSVRAASLLLLKGMSQAQLSKVGKASGHMIEVQAMFYINSGHCRHHMNILNERYLNHR